MNKLLILVGVFSLFSSCSTWQENEKKDYLNIEFNGIITKKFLDPDGRMQPAIILNGQEKYYIINDIFNSMDVGDTTFKEKGSMKYHWIKNGDTLVFYQQYGNKDLTDSI